MNDYYMKKNYVEKEKEDEKQKQYQHEFTASAAVHESNEKINKLEEEILQLDANIDSAFELFQTLEDQFRNIKNIIIRSNFFSLDRELAKMS